MKRHLRAFLKPAFLIAPLAPLLAQSQVFSPSETLLWDLESFEAESGAEWTTTRFPTLRGATYTLVSSHDLIEWEPLQSFYAVDNELHLALFEKTPAPVTEGSSSPDPDSEPPAPIVTVGFLLRPLPNSSGIAVSWSPIGENPATEKVHRILPGSLEEVWENHPIYFNLHENYFFFLSVLASTPPASNFVETDPFLLSAEDNAAFQTLAADFSTIETAIQAQAALEQSLPFPPPPHPDSKCFYRLECTFTDSDGDGLHDAFEFYYGIGNAFQEDSDGNGILDGLEDSDGDGLTNLQELMLGLDPTNGFTHGQSDLAHDSDEDGVPDYEELLAETNPQSDQSFPPRFVSIARSSRQGTPDYVAKSWDSGEIWADGEDDEYIAGQALETTFPFPSEIPDKKENIAESPNVSNDYLGSFWPHFGSRSEKSERGESQLFSTQEEATHYRVWLEQKPSPETEIKFPFLRVTEVDDSGLAAVVPWIKLEEFAIKGQDGETKSEPIDLIPDRSLLDSLPSPANYQSRKMTTYLLPVEVKAYRPTEPKFAFEYQLTRKERVIPEAELEEDGIGIRVNQDDDNENGIGDGGEFGAITDEDDLIEIEVVSPEVPDGFQLVVKKSPALKLWSDDKRTELIAGAGNEIVIPEAYHPERSYWMEIATTLEGGMIEFHLRPEAGGDDVLLKHFDVETFTELGLGFSGETFDLPDTGGIGVLPLEAMGTYDMCETLYKKGYNVYYYAESSVLSAEGWEGAGPAYAECFHQLRLGGIERLGSFGWSHGGSAVKLLYARLESEPPSERDYSVVLSGYIDAIAKKGGIPDNGLLPETGTAAETGYPKLTIRHANWYQTNRALTGLRGDATIGVVFPRDLEVIIPNVNHLSIVSNPTVILSVVTEMEAAFITP